MTSAPVLDIDALLRPIPGDKPAGLPLPDAILMQLDENRREPIPGDPTTEKRKADWPKVLQVTTAALTDTGKDMNAAARLVEAATKVHGAAGLRDGLRLLQRLFADCWDRLLPEAEPGDTTDIRETKIVWLNDTTRGAKFPQTIAGMPLFKASGVSFGPFDMRSKERKSEFDGAVAAAQAPELEALRTTHADLLAARQALADLSNALTTRRVDQNTAPDYTSIESPSNIGQAIERCIAMVEEIAKRRSFPLVPPAPGAAPVPASKPKPGESPATAPMADTREGLYRQLEQIAAALRRIEPHSPIPYLLERCVKLGALPFPQLMKAMVREKNALDELDRLLGIEEKEKEKK